MVSPNPASVPNYSFFDPVTDVVAAQQADKLTTTNFILRVPWWDYAKNDYTYVTISSMELWNQSQVNLFCLPFLLAGLYSALVSLQAQTQNLQRGFVSRLVALIPGDNVIDLTSIGLVNIDFTTVGLGIDYWYGSTIIRKLGVYMWGYPRQSGELHFINARSLQISAPAGTDQNGIFIHLEPGCYATAECHQRVIPVDVPPILYSIDGGINFQEMELGGTGTFSIFPI